MKTETKQNRFKSPVFWVGIICQLLVMLVAFDVIDVSQMESVKVVAIAIGEAVTAFSISNNPSIKNGY